MIDTTEMIEIVVEDNSKAKEVFEFLSQEPKALSPQVSGEDARHICCGFKNLNTKQVVVGKLAKAFPDVSIR